MIINRLRESEDEQIAKHMQEMLSIIKGEGKKYAWMGSGFRTYPTSIEDGQKCFHSICIMLEAKGLIRRKIINMTEMVLWEAI